jgi:hypothetical protein
MMKEKIGNKKRKLQINTQNIMNNILNFIAIIQNNLMLLMKKIRIFLLKIKLNYVKFKILLSKAKYYILRKILDILLYLVEFVKIHRYAWVVLLAIVCVVINIIFKDWPYKDYIWIFVIVSLLITSINDIQENKNENEY